MCGSSMGWDHIGQFLLTVHINYLWAPMTAVIRSAVVYSSFTSCKLSLSSTADTIWSLLYMRYDDCAFLCFFLRSFPELFFLFKYDFSFSDADFWSTVLPHRFLLVILSIL